MSSRTDLQDDVVVDARRTKRTVVVVVNVVVVVTAVVVTVVLVGDCLRTCRRGVKLSCPSNTKAKATAKLHVWVADVVVVCDVLRR